MAQVKVKFFKVTGLPSEPEANSIYYVIGDSFAEWYVTDADGFAAPCGNSAMINALVAAANLAPLGATNAAINLKQDKITTYNPDKPMANPLIFDDFLGNLLGVAWTPTGEPPVIQVGQSLCSLSGNVTTNWQLRGIERPLAQNDDFTVICKLANKSVEPEQSYIGIYMLNSNDEYLFLALSEGSFTAKIKIYAGNHLNQSDVASGGLSDSQRINYLKIYVTADGDVYFSISNDGIRWETIHSIEGEALSFFNIGLGVVARGNVNQTGCFDWVGVYNGSVGIIGG